MYACGTAGEADDRLGTLDLPGSQLPLLQALMSAAPNTPVVLVLLNGGPLSSPWAYTNAQAVLEAWYVVVWFEVGVEGSLRVVLCGRLVVGAPLVVLVCLSVRYPGYSGGQAIVDALFGVISPAGRLPVTIVSGVDQLPLYTDFFLNTAPGRTHW